jgi:hypothetical protein
MSDLITCTIDCRGPGSVLLAAHPAALAGGSAILWGTRRPGRHPARRHVRDEEAEELEDQTKAESEIKVMNEFIKILVFTVRGGGQSDCLVSGN